MPLNPREPLRLSEIKASIWGGLRFDHILDAGWELQPSIGIVAKQIDKLALEIRDFKVPLVKAIRTVMMPSILKNFVHEGRPEPWTPLSTFAEIQRGGRAHPILYRSGLLERTASSFGIWSVGATSATIKSLPSSVWYGVLQQGGYGDLKSMARMELSSAGAKLSTEALTQRAMDIFLGGPQGGRKQSKFVIPARPFIMFQTEDIEEIQQVFVEWMEDKANEVGRGWNLV
jgi:phage gpG-like protein